MNVAIVEDVKTTAECLKALIQDYGQTRNQKIEVSVYSNGLAFLSTYKKGFDLVLMDIEMPMMDGMNATKELRKKDSNVIVVFVTNLAQYAIQGYEVSALDYILKPVKKEQIESLMDRVAERIGRQGTRKKILLTDNSGTRVLYPNDIYYIEILDHRLHYHTKHGVFSVYGTLSSMEKKLENCHFSRCHACYLVNLKYVKSVKRYKVMVGETELEISRPKYMAFKEALCDYLGETI